MYKRFIQTKSLYASDLKNVWIDIKPDIKTVLSIVINDTKTITAKEQFETLFKGRRLKQPNIKDNEILFFLILQDNLFFIRQIDKFRNLIFALSNFDNWQDVTITTSKTELKGDTSATSEGNALSNNANSDNNSLMEKSKIEAYLSIDDKKREVIPANTLAQANSKDKRTDKTESTNNTDIKGSSKSSNSSIDYQNYLNIKLRTLRQEFWSQFDSLFML